MPRGRPLALITGASAGIGAAFARALAEGGHDLVLAARRAHRLEALAAELRTAHGAVVTVLPRDLAAADGADALLAALESRDLRVDWLVNNAGYGIPGRFDATAWADHAAFVQLMVTAPAALAHGLLPGMRARGYGRIVNVASLAAFVPGTAGHTLYGAAKAFLVRFSESLAAENLAHGVHVCALCPGFTHSEFHDVTGTRAAVARLPRLLWQGADEVAAAGIAAVERGEAVHVPGRANRAIRTFARLVPPALGRRLADRQAHRFRDTGADRAP